MIVSLILAAGAILATWAAYHPRQWLVARWRTELAVLDDSESSVRLRQLPKLGLDGLDLVIDQLVSPRPRLRMVALETLSGEIEKWRKIPLEDASRNVARFVGRLRVHAGQIDVSLRGKLEKLVLDVIRWPFDRDEVDVPQILEDCEHILASFYRRNLDERLIVEPAGESDDWPSVELPQSPAPGSSQPPAAPAAGPVAGRFSLSDDPDDATGATGSLSDDPAMNDTPNAGSLSDATTSEPMVGTPIDPMSVAVPTPRADRTGPVPWETLDVMELAEYLAHADAALALQAAGELRKRGFSGLWLALVERLVDPDPRQRIEALNELPHVQRFDATPWLLRLSEDSDPGVRRVVVALMAASPDPRIVKRLREMLANERDPDVDASLRNALEQSTPKY